MIKKGFTHYVSIQILVPTQSINYPFNKETLNFNISPTLLYKIQIFKKWEIIKPNYQIIPSELLHTSKGLGMLHTLHNFMSILDMLVEIVDPRVENVAETMFPKVLDGNNSIDFGKSVLRVYPEWS